MIKNGIVYNSHRYFAMYDYNVSHGQLLLRSEMRKGYSENIDIIFFNVQYLELFTMVNGLEVSMVDKSRYAHHAALQKCLSFNSMQLFQLQSGKDKFLIAAYFIKIYKNSLNPYESSLGVNNLIRGEEIIFNK